MSSISVSRSITSIGQPFASTRRLQPRVRALVEPVRTPSPSLSVGQPLRVDRGASRRRRALVDAVEHGVAVGVGRAAANVDRGAPRRIGALIEAVEHGVASASSGQPFASTVAPFGVPSQASMPSNTPSPSVSIGQPVASTRAPGGVPGQRSFLLEIPSWSSSDGAPPKPNEKPPKTFDRVAIAIVLRRRLRRKLVADVPSVESDRHLIRDLDAEAGARVPRELGLAVAPRVSVHHAGAERDVGTHGNAGAQEPGDVPLAVNELEIGAGRVDLGAVGLGVVPPGSLKATGSLSRRPRMPPNEGTGSSTPHSAGGQ